MFYYSIVAFFQIYINNVTPFTAFTILVEVYNTLFSLDPATMFQQQEVLIHYHLSYLTNV